MWISSWLGGALLQQALWVSNLPRGVSRRSFKTFVEHVIQTGTARPASRLCLKRRVLSFPVVSPWTDTTMVLEMKEGGAYLEVPGAIVRQPLPCLALPRSLVFRCVHRSSFST